MPRPSGRFPFHQDDLRYHHTVTDTRNESNAVVLCIMDTSGSMDTSEKISGAELFFPALSISSARAIKTSRSCSSRTTPKRGKSPRRSFFTKANRAARSFPRVTVKALEIIDAALPSGALERVRFSLLRRRQLRVGQRGGAQSRRGARPDRQSFRLRRDQAARARAITAAA